MPKMRAFTRSSKNPSARRDSSRQIVTVLGIAAALAFGPVLFTGLQALRSQPPAAQSDEEIYTGSILYMPDQGRDCRQILFDNLSGHFTDNGVVDCERAAYRSRSAPKYWSAARMRVISTGFRQR